MTQDVFVIPTSFAQQRLWFLDQLEPNTAAFNMSAAVRLKGALNLEALEGSLCEVVRRHEALRTTFADVDGEPVQVIASHHSPSLPLVEVAGDSASQHEAELLRLARTESRKPFDLAAGPLLRVTLLRLRQDEHVLLLTMHHIISDGWSISIFVREMMTLYRAFLENLPATLPALPIQYADFALWQREWLQGEVLQKAAGYWRRQLGGELPVLELPTDKPRPAIQTFRGGRHCKMLPKTLVELLRKLSNREGATLYMTLLAAFKALLSRYTNQEEIIVGSPVAGRNHAGVEDLIGFFINTLVLRTHVVHNQTFRELLHRVREVTLEAYAHQDLPFEKLLEELQPERDLSHTPLFQVYFNMLNFPDTKIDLPGLMAELLAPPEVEAKFDLTLYVKEESSGVRLELVYNADLFASARMAEMLEQYFHLLSQIASAPDARLTEFSLVTESAKGVLPDPRAPLRDDWFGAVHTLFTEQARRLPQNLAAADRHDAWNYQDLNARSNQLAQYLITGGIERGDRVAIYGHRSASLVWALLGILKAGAAFVILDPAYPASRLVACLDVAKPKGWLQIQAAGEPPMAIAEFLETSPQLCCRLTLPRRSVADAQGLLMEFSTDAPAISVGADDLAYVAFTSGSTGIPKGILGRHGPLTHFLPWLTRTFGLNEADRFCLLSGISHDPLHRDVFTPLQLGACVCIPDPDELTIPGRMAVWLKRERISIAHLTPAMGQLLTQALPEDAASASTALRYVFLVGDVLTQRDVARLRKLAPAVTCVNYYGSTETQRAVGYFVVPDEPPAAHDGGGKEILPLGRGIEDVQLLVLNAEGRLAGIGELGEISLRSPHLAKGYLGDESLTRERFITNPFTNASHDRLYRTGDLGRYLPDGNVEPCGRADNQVKMRGFRVELGEIEATLRKHPGVGEAVVIVREDVPGDKRLVGYIIAPNGNVAAGGDETPNALAAARVGTLANELRGYLKERLPDYMMPSAFVLLDVLPVTPNGKVDRRSLPAPAEVPSDGEELFAAPRTPVEEILAGIWKNVLNSARVGIHDDFFALGGHSLIATQVISRVRAAFQVEMPLRRLFESPTVAEMAESIQAATQAGQRTPVPPLSRVARTADLPLSFAQQRLWFLDHLEPGNAFYNVGAGVRLAGALDVGALEKSLDQIIRRHETLRTTFVESDGQPRQVIAAAIEVPLEFEDLSALSEQEREQEAQRLTTEEVQRPFDLSRGPLVRLRLLRLDEQEHVVLVTMHHIISDGWSHSVFVREMAALYEAYAGGLEPSLPVLPIQYADFADWQRRGLQGGALEQELAYWTEQLSGAPPMLELPTDRPRPAVITYRGARHRLALGQALSESLKTLSRDESSTLFMTLLAAFNALLYRYTGQEDISVGSPIAGRQQVEVEPLIGFFANMLVLRSDLSGDPTFRELLAGVRDVTLDAYKYQDVPFEMLVERLQPARSLSHTPLFQVALTLQNVPAERLEVSGLTLRPLEIESGTAKFDLLLTLKDTEAGLDGFFEYNSDLFDASTIERMTAHLGNLLAGVVANPDARISDLPLLDDAERDQLLFEWNSTSAYPHSKCLHQLFEDWAARTPDAVALTFEQDQLTYAELNARANRLARRLRRAGVRDGSLVGVYMNRSLEMVTTLLSILKAGGAYVPLNPSHAKERLAFMLEDARVEALVTQKDIAGDLPELSLTPLCVDTDWDEFAGESAENLDQLTTPDSLAYVIYTSGSTGQPKGVLITHANVARLFAATEHWFAFDERNVWTLFHSYAFDFSVWEMWGALLYGGRLVVVPYWVSRSPHAFFELVCREKVTVLNQTPSAFRQFIQAEPPPTNGLKLSLRVVIFGGEALELSSLKSWVELHGDQRPQLVNMYGITETTVHVTYQRVTAEHIRDAHGSLIGRPIPDLQVYVLDSRLRPVPVGVPGEMYVGGNGLARGYLNQPELSAERFIANPFSSGEGARLYRTGDLARFRASGTLEYLGRSDHQVKIRGFRVELGEIEAVLAKHPHVAEAVVLALDDDSGTKSLVAYLALRGRSAPTIGELHAFLKDKLPEYMIPRAFVPLEALPLTTNGKVDRKALLSMERARTTPDSRFAAARNEVERALAEIWAKVLGVDKVGVHDNFFELGGDSILSIQIISRALREGIHLTPKQLFQHQTVAELAAVAGVAAEAMATEGTSTGPVPLTPIQHWFFEENLANPHHYNQAILLESKQPLDPEILERVVRQLVRRHDGLRLRFVRHEAGWRQVLAPAESDADAPLVTQLNLSEVREGEQSATVAEAAASAQASLDLSDGPVLRVILCDLGVGRSSRLLLIMHHLVVDGVSWRILLEELQTGYEQLNRGEELKLAKKKTSFKQWAEKLSEYARSDELGEEIGYWLDAPRAGVPGLRSEPKGQAHTNGSAQTVTVKLGVEETQALLQGVPAAYRTQINDALLAALVLAFRECGGGDTLLIDLEGHGRQELFKGLDTSLTVGWFTTQFPVLLNVSGTGSRVEALKAVKEQLRTVPRRGLGYGLLRYMRDDAEVVEKLRRQPQAEVRFNYLGQFDQLIEEAGHFAVAAESAGPTIGAHERLSHALDINSRVSNSQLEVSWKYSEYAFARETVEALAAGYVRELKRLTEDCLAPGVFGYTPSDFPLAKVEQTTLDSLAATYGPVADLYPLSPLQQGLLFHALQAPGTGVYFLRLSCSFRGELDVAAFRRAWQEVVNRHTILRTAIVWEDLDEPLQVVKPQAEVPWEQADWRSLPVAVQQENLQAYLEANSAHNFDLSKAPLMRLALFRLSDDVHHFVWSSHHIALDGWSYPIIIREVLASYDAFRRGLAPRLPPSIPYGEYIGWLQRQELSDARSYWRQTLKGFTAPTPLGRRTAAPDAATRKETQGFEKLRLSPEETTAVQSFAHEHQVTVSTLVQGAWALLLSSLSGGQEEVVFGVVVSGRPVDLVGSEAMVGLLINTLPLRVRLSGDEAPLSSWLKRIQEQQVESHQYGYSPLVEVQKWSDVPPGQPLFESFITFLNYPVHRAVEEWDGPVKVGHIEFMERVSSALNLIAGVRSCLELELKYDCRRFEATAVRRMLAQLCRLLNEFAARPHASLAACKELLSEADRQQREAKQLGFRAARRRMFEKVKQQGQSKISN